MSTIAYTRRAKGVDTSMVNVYSMEEVKIYFTDESEWRLASLIYWERYRLGKDHAFYTRKYAVAPDYCLHLLTQYEKFMEHEYMCNKVYTE